MFVARAYFELPLMVARPASAPQASSVIALALEDRAEICQRTLQHILQIEA